MGVWPFGSSSSAAQDAARAASAESAAAPPVTSPSAPGDDDDDDNPFIIFRRAVDDQFRLMATGLSFIPSILHELQVKGEGEANQDTHESRWSHDSFSDRAEQPLAFTSQHFQHPPPSPRGWRRASPPSEEALAAARTLLLQSREACARAGVSPIDILKLYRDPESAHPFLPHREPAWLSVGWFHRSPYSPAQLETHTLAHQHGSMWRAAFEDLLSASTHREPTAREAWTGARQDQRLYLSWAQTPRDWMLGLQCRGVLPPQLPSLYSLGSTQHMDHVFSGLMHGLTGRELGPSAWAARRDFVRLAREIGTFDADEQRQCASEPDSRPTYVEKPSTKPKLKDIPLVSAREQEATELDAYEQFLGKVTADAVVSAASAVQETPVEPVKPAQPVSTLSTTERTTHPDGTITTRVMVRRVFADGSEQTTESESTTMAQHAQENQSGKQDQAKEKSGWFWR